MSATTAAGMAAVAELQLTPSSQPAQELNLAERVGSSEEGLFPGNADATTGSNEVAIVVYNSTLKNWEVNFSAWLSKLIDFFGLAFQEYINGLTERLEKLDYY